MAGTLSGNHLRALHTQEEERLRGPDPPLPQYQDLLSIRQKLNRGLVGRMAKPIGDLCSWVEVVPAIFVFTRQTCSFPVLETIEEEEEEVEEENEELQ